jgi:TrmH family RNA methyltransferase
MRKIWRSVRRRKGREDSGLFLLEGPNLVADALDAGIRMESVVATEVARRTEEVSTILGRCADAGVPAEILEDRELAELADTVSPQGIAALARIPAAGWQDVRDLRILVLDGIQDPGNVGTLVRTAEALRLGAVVCLPGTADPWSPKVTRSAAGSTLRLAVLKSSWANAVEELRTRSVEVWAADAAAAGQRRGDPAPARLALVLGNEACGVSAEVRQDADRLVSIAMTDTVDSLNVAAAGAILIDRIFSAGER